MDDRVSFPGIQLSLGDFVEKNKYFSLDSGSLLFALNFSALNLSRVHQRSRLAHGEPKRKSSQNNSPKRMLSMLHMFALTFSNFSALKRYIVLLQTE